MPRSSSHPIAIRDRRSNILVSALASIAMAFGAVPAAAAPASSAAIDPVAVQALHFYATCVAEQSAPSAEKLLQMDVGAPDYETTIRAFAKGHPGCVPGRKLQFAGLLFAGALAEALIKNGYSGQGAADLITKASPESYLPPHGMGEAIGMCVARAVPKAVESVLASDYGSKEEAAALDLTGPALADCIQKGKTLTLNRQAVRAFYALGAWRLISDKGAPPAETGN